MTEEDALNLGRMMLHYCKLSAEGKRRAWRIFELILKAALTAYMPIANEVLNNDQP